MLKHIISSPQRDDDKSTTKFHYLFKHIIYLSLFFPKSYIFINLLRLVYCIRYRRK